MGDGRGDHTTCILFKLLLGWFGYLGASVEPYQLFPLYACPYNWEGRAAVVLINLIEDLTGMKGEGRGDGAVWMWIEQCGTLMRNPIFALAAAMAAEASVERA